MSKPNKIDVILGMDIGGTNMRFGLVSENYELSDFKIESTQKMLNIDNPLSMLEDSINKYCEENLKGRNLKAISLGFPSTIDKTRRRVTSTPNIKSFQNLAVSDYLEQKLDVPIFVNRDVNLLFEYDMYKLKIDQSGIIIGFYIGTGFGNAISVDGKLMLGKNGVAAELGHTPTLNNKQHCGCGNDGCIETIASGVYLERLRDEYFSDTEIKDIFIKHIDKPLIKEFIENISLPIATEINIFDPDYIILGGGVVQMNGFPIKMLMDYVYKHTRKPYPAENIDALYSNLAQENGVIGAGIYGYKRLRRSDYL